MKNIEQIKNELFKDFKEVYERCEGKPTYMISLTGNFKNVTNKEFNYDFQKELYQILPKNVLTLGYICSCCAEWMTTSTPKSLCWLCDENYENDLDDLKKDMNDETAKEWVDYYSFKEDTSLCIVFTTDTEIDSDSIKNTFKPLNYIENIYIQKEDYCLDGQLNVVAYKDMYLIEEEK